jgi:hypothetical protein
MASSSRPKRQRKSAQPKPPEVPTVKYHNPSKEIQVVGTEWVFNGFKTMQTQIELNFDYYDSNGERELNTNPLHHEGLGIRFIPQPGQTLYVLKYKGARAVVTTERCQTFGEVWASVIPVDHIPMTLLPMETPILEFAAHPIAIQKNPEEYARYKDQLTEIKTAAVARNRQQYIDFLNNEIIRCQT